MKEVKTSTRFKQPSLEATLKALQTYDGQQSATLYYGLSGLSEDTLERLKPAWETLPAESRSQILTALADISESNFELDYRTIGMFGLEDNDPDVRKAAIDLLWFDQSLPLMDRLIDLAQWDEAVEVRAAATSELGCFILMGELGELSEAATLPAQDAAANIWNNLDEDVQVRRRALEAISNCSHEMVTEAIDEAYQSGEQPLRVSAVFAMGRSYDERWRESVLRELVSSELEMRYEAARAAGELAIEEAVPYLVRLARGEDREIKEVAVWSLGEIGGKEAQRVLNEVAEAAQADGDDDLLEAVEDAIGNASLMSGDFPTEFGYRLDD